MEDCLGCDLTSGKVDLPGGRIYATNHWIVEHCVGPLGVGTLIVKPLRHCTRFWELTPEEASEIGPLLSLVGSAIRSLLEPDQLYICLWSHAGWAAGHLHFVLQPSWNHYQGEYGRPGPFLQVNMFEANVEPPRDEVEAFAVRAREIMGRLNAGNVP
jgi:diadenosine tetraphosphate (Ap4A) HIT family hydrolase